MAKLKAEINQILALNTRDLLAVKTWLYILKNLGGLLITINAIKQALRTISKGQEGILGWAWAGKSAHYMR